MAQNKNLDFRKINDVLNKAKEINDQLIDLSEKADDFQYELDAIVDKGIWEISHFNTEISKVNEKMAPKLLELVKQLDNINRQIKTL